MKSIDLQGLVRKNIWALEPYSCARTEFTGNASVFLDANENPYNSPYNRYPDPFQIEVKEQIKKIKGVNVENIFLGNGSDEAIDLMYRVFCEAGKDNAVAIDPTYGMYKVCADINNVEYRSVKLDDKFEFDPDTLLKATDENTKLIWICSPNNPTGNAMPKEKIEKVLNSFKGIVIVDEAYIDFSSQKSLSTELSNHANLIILQTFSKAWGSAGIRLGMAFASKAIIDLMNKVKYPYNINILTQEQAKKMIANAKQVEEWVKILLNERTKLVAELGKLACVKLIYPSDANFILVKTTDANKIYNYLVGKGIIVRNRNNVSLCMGCVRISIGTPEENTILLNALKAYSE